MDLTQEKHKTRCLWLENYRIYFLIFINRTIAVNLRKRLCFYEPLSIGMVIDIVGHLVPYED